MLPAELDVGFVGRRIAQKGLQTQPYVADELVLIATPPGQKMAGRANVSLDGLSGEAFILRVTGQLYMVTRREVRLSAAPPEFAVFLGE